MFTIVITRSQNRNMNDATALQLAQAIQSLATAAAASPTAPAAIRPPPIPDHISPYKGNALDLSSRTGTSLFQKGSEALASKFTEKVEDLHLFLADLMDRSKTCRWNSTTHGIISLVISGTTYNLLDDYGKVNATQIKTTHVARVGAGDVRAHQNTQMMYECLKNSITDNAKLALASRENLSNQGLWHPSDKTPEEQTLAMVAQQQQNKPKGLSSAKKESTSKSPSKDKDKEKEKKGPPFAHKEVNWVTQSNGMVRHITTVLPTTNTAIGTLTKSRNAILTRR